MAVRHRRQTIGPDHGNQADPGVVGCGCASPVTDDRTGSRQPGRPGVVGCGCASPATSTIGPDHAKPGRPRCGRVRLCVTGDRRSDRITETRPTRCGRVRLCVTGDRRSDRITQTRPTRRGRVRLCVTGDRRSDQITQNQPTPAWSGAVVRHRRQTIGPDHGKPADPGVVGCDCASPVTDDRTRSRKTSRPRRGRVRLCVTGDRRSDQITQNQPTRCGCA